MNLLPGEKRTMKIIGLTGGIGSGKTTVAQYLRAEDIPVIDADQTGHELLEKDPDIGGIILEYFGRDILVNGVISREALAEKVFVDADARKKLNALLHPAIISAIMQQCRDLQVRGYPLAVVEAALIGEGAQLEPWLCGLILVLAETEVRVERLVRYRNMTETDARARIDAQSDPEQKRHAATWIVCNNDGPEALREQVKELVMKLRAFSGE